MSKALVLDEGKWKESSSRRPVRKVSVLEKHPFNLANIFTVISAVSDFAFSSYPILILWKVQLRLRTKIALCCLMGTGVL